MRFEKLGRVFVADRQHEWMLTHAAWPRAVHLREDRFRVFFSARDARNRSHIAFVEIDLRSPAGVLAVSEAPVLSPRPAGSFDDAGVIPCAACLSATNASIGLRTHAACDGDNADGSAGRTGGRNAQWSRGSASGCSSAGTGALMSIQVSTRSIDSRSRWIWRSISASPWPSSMYLVKRLV